MKELCRLDIIKYSVSHRMINECNEVSTYCGNASSVNSYLKTKLSNISEGRLTIDE